MGHYLKDPEATLDYSIDWGARYLRDGETIAASSWAVSPNDAGGLAIVGDTLAGAVTSVTVTGGETGAVYRLTNRITLANGLEDERSLGIRVGAR